MRLEVILRRERLVAYCAFERSFTRVGQHVAVQPAAHFIGIAADGAEEFPLGAVLARFHVMTQIVGVVKVRVAFLAGETFLANVSK